MAQAGLVMDAIRRNLPGVRLELVTMKTTGDKILDRRLEAIGGKGLFVKELDDALQCGRVDICVHSYKDLPLPDNPSLPVVAVSEREDPRDVLILPQGVDTLPAGRPIGTSSQRRTLQLSALYPDNACKPVRGNLATRLRKLDSGEFGALVLAAAGIRRLGLWNRVHRVFDIDEMLPAACQGMLAVQGRAGEDHSYLSGVHNADAFDASVAERSFIEEMEASCASPVAAFARIDGESLSLCALYQDGKHGLLKGKKTGARQDAGTLGLELARTFKRDAETKDGAHA